MSEYVASCVSDCALSDLLSMETPMGLFKELVYVVIVRSEE